jgi:hypothetical protein
LFVTNGLTTENLTTLFEKSSHTGKHFCSAIAKIIKIFNTQN